MSCLRLASHYSAVRGSISPTYTDILSDASGPYDFSGNTGVTMRLQHILTAEIVDFTMTPRAPLASGVMDRDWLIADLDITEGLYKIQMFISRGAAGVEIFDVEGAPFEVVPATPAP